MDITENIKTGKHGRELDEEEIKEFIASIYASNERLIDTMSFDPQGDSDEEESRKEDIELLTIQRNALIRRIGEKNYTKYGVDKAIDLSYTEALESNLMSDISLTS